MTANLNHDREPTLTSKQYGLLEAEYYKLLAEYPGVDFFPLWHIAVSEMAQTSQRQSYIWSEMIPQRQKVGEIDKRVTDWELGQSEVWPSLDTFVRKTMERLERQIQDRQNDPQKVVQDIVTVVQGLPASGKTQVAWQTEQTYGLMAKRLKQQYGANIEVEYMKWDDVETGLMELAPTFISLMSKEYGAKYTRLWYELVRPAFEELLIALNTELGRYIKIARTGMYQGQTYSDELRHQIQTIINEGVNYRITSFDRGEAYPENFLGATATLTKLRLTERLYQLQEQRPKNNSTLIVIVDKVGRTEYFDPNHTISFRRYGTELALDLALGHEPFNVLNREGYYVNWIEVASLIPYQLTAERIGYMMARNLDEANLVARLFGKSIMGESEWQRLRTGGLFTHLNKAELAAEFMLWTLSREVILPLPRWMAKRIQREWKEFKNIPVPRWAESIAQQLAALQLGNQTRALEEVPVDEQLLRLAVRMGSLTTTKAMSKNNGVNGTANFSWMLALNHSPEYLDHLVRNKDWLDAYFRVILKIQKFSDLKDLHDELFEIVDQIQDKIQGESRRAAVKVGIYSWLTGSGGGEPGGGQGR